MRVNLLANCGKAKLITLFTYSTIYNLNIFYILVESGCGEMVYTQP